MVILLIPVVLLTGAAAVSVLALEHLPTAMAWTLAICVLVLVPLALFPGSRGIAGNGFVIASYAFGLINWLFAMAYVYLEWGLVPLIIGLVFGGVGVIPIAFILSIFDAAWGALGNLATIGVLWGVSRGLGFWLIEKAALRQVYMDYEQSKHDEVIPAKRLD